MKRIQLLILGSLLSSYTCSHSLEFLSTGRGPGDQPSFEQLTVYDGVPISHCDASTKQEHLKLTLESKNFPKDCFEAFFNILDSLLEFPSFVNDTVYVVQRRRGCVQAANGTLSAFEAWAVNGMDFMTFNPESQKWTSLSPSAKVIEHRWNTKTEMNNAFRNFIAEQCPLLIQKIQLRSVSQNTELRVFAKPKDSNGQFLLTCHVTSSDTLISPVHLIGDGATRAIWITVAGPLPSEDGSVIMRLTAGIPQSANTYTYGCRVQAGGHNITVFWDFQISNIQSGQNGTLGENGFSGSSFVTNGYTLDGRYLLYPSSNLWQMDMILLGLCCVVLIITIISHTMICLLKCERNTPISPVRVDPELVEQLTRFMNSVPYPDLQNVIVSYTRGIELDRESQVQWEEKKNLRDQSYYDPDYFGCHVTINQGIESVD